MKNILVAEDETAIRDFVVINLERAGYNVTEAENGAVALQKYDEMVLAKLEREGKTIGVGSHPMPSSFL